ncbi:MAG: hypothetical protein ACE5FA_06270, partial [Dehalococcoidia bacterium]
SEAVRFLRDRGYEVYDFRHPSSGDNGFDWSEIDSLWKEWDVRAYVWALGHPTAKRGFKTDMDALKAADVCLLVMPCNRSAHLELGWAVGSGRRGLIWIPDGTPIEPELMYGMCSVITTSLDDVVEFLESENNRRGCERGNVQDSEAGSREG